MAILLLVLINEILMQVSNKNKIFKLKKYIQHSKTELNSNKQ